MTVWGALIGLVLSIFLIIKKIQPIYSLVLGAVIGGLIGGFPLTVTISLMLEGVRDITPAVLRILAAGVLSGVLVKTNAAASISCAIITKLGVQNAYLALALATMLLTAIGVFIDVAVITVAPVALSLGYRLSISKEKLLLIMIGAGKCGNIISPNPNTIVAADNFNVNLSSVMCTNLLPAIIGLLFVVYVIPRIMFHKGVPISEEDISIQNENLPSFAISLIAPIIAIFLLALRPLCNVIIDPMIALPTGGMIGLLSMRKFKQTRECLSYGLEKMSFVAILLIGTGAIAGIIKASALKDVMINFISWSNLGDVFIAPISGALMSAATASTTAGATIASSSFSGAIIATGISAIWGAAMVNSGATVLDHLPHGSFFHATAGAVNLAFRIRLRLIIYETLIGSILAALSIIFCLIMS
jgi:GntP family gluconate:H+ symporter